MTILCLFYIIITCLSYRHAPPGTCMYYCLNLVVITVLVLARLPSLLVVSARRGNMKLLLFAADNSVLQGIDTALCPASAG